MPQRTILSQDSLIIFSAGFCGVYLSLLLFKVKNHFKTIKSIPLLGSHFGGLALYFFMIFPGALFFLPEPGYPAIMAGSLLFLLIGMLDKSISRAWSIILQIAAVLITASLGIKIKILSSIFFGKGEGIHQLSFFSIPATILWILIIIKLIEFTDFFDGLTLGVSFIIISGLLYAFFEQQGPLLFEKRFCIFILGVILGMLRFHHHPGKFSLGKGGIMALGFIIGGLSILGASKSVAAVGIALPLFILWLPVLVGAFLIGISYLKGTIRGNRYNYEDISGPIKSDFFKITPKRIVTYMYLVYLYINFVVLNIVFSNNIPQSIMFMLFGFILLIQIGKLIFVIPHESQKNDKPQMLSVVDILSVSIDNVSMNAAMRRIEGYLASSELNLIVTPNTIAVNMANEDPDFKRIINTADLRVPDGIGLIWAANFFNTPLTERVAGIDLMKNMVSLAQRMNKSFFILGTTDKILEEAAIILREKYKNISIAGMHNGFFSENEEEAIVKKINDSRADILFVALGLPKQEKWIDRHRDKLKVKIAIGIGGSFDVISENLKRAPMFMQKTGLEWLWRLIQEPRRCHRMIALPIFVAKVFRKKVLSSDKSVNNKIPDIS
jgi:N-acetylglucosaminyldiphosphoundecaprenol N-acetyl-beta-D-mannosaminyltransferase